MTVDWRRKYGWTLPFDGRWLVGHTSRVYAAFGLPIGAACALSPTAHDPRTTCVRVFFTLLAVGCILLVGTTNTVAIELATGTVRTRRGLFGLARRRVFVRPQIDGVFMDVNEDSRHPGSYHCSVGVQAGLGRWALYRTQNGDRAADFYRDLKAATGFAGV